MTNLLITSTWARGVTKPILVSSAGKWEVGDPESGDDSERAKDLPSTERPSSFFSS